MNLHQLEYFDRLSHTLHYQRAAEELGISQPALSRSIAALEEELGAPLFVRRGRGVELSRYGTAFAAHISTAMREIGVAKSRVRELSDPRRITLNIGVNYTLAATFLPALAGRYTALHPDEPTFFTFYQGNTPGIIKNIREGICDMGFCSFAQDEPEISFYPVTSKKMCVLVAPGHPLAGRRSLTLEDVIQYPLVLSIDRTYYIEDMLRRRGMTPTVACRMGEDRGTAALVAQGFGLAILPHDEQLRACGVELIPLDEPEALRTYYLACPRTRVLTGEAESFARFVRETVKNAAPAD